MAGWRHSGAITSDGELYLWGDKSKYALGIVPPELKDDEDDPEKASKIYYKSLYVIKPERFKKENFGLADRPILYAAGGKKFTVIATLEPEYFLQVKEELGYPTEGHYTVKLRTQLSRRQEFKHDKGQFLSQMEKHPELSRNPFLE